ncbi:FliH/SctL family protein [Persephonella sp.]
MPSLNIEDFGKSLQKPNSDEMTKEQIESFYQNQIKKIQKEFEEKLKQTYQQGIEEGYRKGVEETEKKLTENFQKEIEKALKEQEEKLSSEYNKLKGEISSILKEIHKKYKEHVEFVDELILSVLEEIMEYLYVSPENAKYVAEEIRRIVDDLKQSPQITIEVSPDIKPYIQSAGENVKIIEREDFKSGDFTVKIENVQFESRFKEKVNILKDEIKREIKKNSPI